MKEGPLTPRFNEIRSISLGLGDLIVKGNIRKQEDWVIYGLGSCIGIILSDAQARAAGMAHILLPQSRQSEEGKPGKFVDTAIPFLLESLEKIGASKVRIVAQIAGGARMLQVAALGDIGARNLRSVQQALEYYGIPLVAASVGGTVGRTLRWKHEHGVAIVSRVGKEETMLTPAPFRFR